MRISTYPLGTFRTIPAAFGCLAIMLGASAARSQDVSPAAGPFQYAAKYVCGVSAPGTTAATIVAPGKYFTAINVHNPNSGTVHFKKLFIIALPSEKQGGKISQSFAAALIPQEAWEIECPDILKHLGLTGGFVKGFVTLISPAELDVVAVYTAASPSTGAVVTMHTERVPKRP